MDLDVALKGAPRLRLPRATPIDIEFSGVSICVEMGAGGMCFGGRKGKKFLLRNLNGRFQSGELTAIMGPSGAGKTTLLNVLTGFSTKGMSGCVRALGRVKSVHGSPLRKQSCYIMQDDHLMGHLTTKEALELSAKLRLPRSASSKDRQLVIQDILETLGLTVSASVKCSSLSGGQKKRLSVALELVNNPPVIFLDEPTTGLDSSASVQCMVLLKQLARGGRTVVMTLHQPSASLYMMLDHVYLLGKGGCCIFQGAPQMTVPYLATFGLMCPLYHSPADFMLEVASEDQGEYTKRMSDEMLAECGVNTGQSKWRKASKNAPSHILPAARKASAIGKMWQAAQGEELQIESLPSKDLRPVSELKKFQILLGRSLWQIHCEWSVTQVRAAFHLMVGILLGMVFSGAGNDGGRTVSNLGFLFINLVYLTYTSMMPAVLRYPTELPVIQKELFNNWYSLASYFAAQLTAGTPVQMVHCLLFCSVAYFGSGQPNEPFRFFMYLLISELVMLRAEGLGLVLGTLVNSVNGTFLGAMMSAVDILFAGYIVLVSDMLPFFQVLSNFSFLSQGFEGVVVSVYGFDRGTLGCPEEGNQVAEGHGVYCHLRYPSQILKRFSLCDDNYWTVDVPALCAWVVFLRVVLFFTLWWRMKSSR
ncbi:ATP-binding cassette sub-family G member 1-like [Ischnura elegans]|uniref:ATP-binding cassette sub-family G member 1-like n=1 Tax=Ischnura elegans TaxID=197161 RepID=UPI001ED8B68F|nr:ATP-binding cassette sub-family G member 1-like [Ischnura elegans]